MGEGLLSVLGEFVKWIGDFFPHLAIVRSTHGAIKFVRGNPRVTLGPALVVYWPLTTEFMEWPVCTQGVNLREQTLVTADNKTIVAGGMLQYEVADLERLFRSTYTPDHFIKDLALTALHSVLCEMEYAELQREQQRGTLLTKLKNEAQRMVQKYGVRVTLFSLTDLSPCRVMRQVVSTAKGEE